ncbi:MAG: 16S rRNA (cytosine(1402)-N(4))-methyltransferase RsmH, partial [Saprospiraceae bacterium]|nr:16S rRNA (cytosine(1402)-N(4))-methyltransferase RsmH [Saprospiraceae bacterium]
MSEKVYHIPVMLNECIEYLNIDPHGIYVDVTYGGGGHSRSILNKLDSDGRLFAFDQDPDAERNIINDDRLVFIDGNFRHLKKLLKIQGVKEVNGILADLGDSSHQLDAAKRGFSYGSDEFLDMRMEPDLKLTAADVLNKYSPEELLRVFSHYGEVRNSRTLSDAIVGARSSRKFKVVP